MSSESEKENNSKKWESSIDAVAINQQLKELLPNLKGVKINLVVDYQSPVNRKTNDEAVRVILRSLAQ